MRDTQTLKDWRGKIIGYIDTQPNGDKILRDFYRRIKGRYHKKGDYTTDFYGRKVGNGDILLTLLNN